MRKGFTILAMAFYALFSPSLSFGQQTVGLFTKNTGEQDGYVLFSPNASKYTYLIDKCGRLIHKWNTGDAPGLDAYILPNGELLSTGKLTNPYFVSTGSVGGLVQKFDWNNKLIWSYAISDSRQMQNHDVYPMPNGNIMVLEWERFTAAEAIAMGRDSAKLKGSDVWSIKVQEIKPVNSADTQVVWQWRLWDHLIQDEDSTKPNYGVVADHPELLNINYADTTVNAYGSADWTHGNAVTYNPDLDQVMISSRNLSEIYIIDHSTTSSEAASHSGGNHKKGGDLLYRWGNPAAYNRGSVSDRRLFVQHNASWIPDGYPGAGNISVFNDGMGRSDGNYSSADILAPPVDSNGNYKLDSGKAYGPDSAYWSYKAPNKTDFYSTVQGGTQVLPNGNVLICEATKGNFFEVDSNKNILWRYVNPDGGSEPVYQGNNPLNIPCFKTIEYLEDYPAFKNITLKPGAPLELNPYSFSSNCLMPYIYYINPLYKIAQLKGYNATTGVADSLNKGQGFVKGVVESQDLGVNSIQFSLIDSTGAITVNTNANYFMPSIGDSILVGGSIIQDNGLTEYNADTIIVKSTGTWQKQPDIVTQLGESYESDLISINNVRLVDTAEWVNNDDTFSVRITNGTDTFRMLVNNKTDLYNMSVPFEEFNATGIEIQNKKSSPYLGNYEIEPRGSFDLERVVQLYKIRQVRIQDPTTGVADSAGSRNNFYLKGIVQSPDFSTNGLNFSIKDSTGSIIIVADNDIDRYTPTPGDSIETRGFLIQHNGLTEVRIDSINVLNNSNPVLTPTLVSGLSESTEAQLVKLSGYHLTDTSEWVAAGDSFNVHISNGTDTFMMQINETTDLFHKNALFEEFNVIGIEIQKQTSAPYFGHYAIEPRGSFDIQRVIQTYNIKQIRVQNALTGIADSAGSQNNFYVKGIVQSPDFSGGGLNFSIKDSTGAIIVSSNSDVNNYKPNTGDSIVLRGLVIQEDGLTEVIPDSISQLTNASPVLKPVNISELSENSEAQLVNISNYYLVDTNQWIASSNSFDVKITNGSDTSLMRINATTDLFKLKSLIGHFNISGIEIQDKPTSPYFGDYLIEPRGIFDLERVVQLYKVRQMRLIAPLNGIADSAGSVNSFYLKGIVQSPDLTSGGLNFSLKDSTGSIIVAASTMVNNYSPATGDSIELRGLLTQVNGLIEVVPDSILVLQYAAPQVTSTDVAALTQSNKAQLVTLKGYYLADTSQWKASGIGFNVNITDGNDTFIMHISASTDLFKMGPLTGIFNITGIEEQDQPTLPYFGNYEIVPRGIYDIERIIQLYNIRQVRVQNPVTGIADSAGSKNSFYIKGVVQSQNLTTNGLNFSLKDSTGAIIVIASADISAYKPAIGDSIQLRGLITQFEGLTEIITDSISVLKNANPVLLTTLVSSLTEANEAHIVTLDHYHLVDKSKWLPKSSGFNVGITDGTDTITMFINDNSDLYHMVAPVEEFNVTGIEIQAQPDSPYFGNYEIEPRGSFDLERVAQLYKIREVRTYNPLTGVADSASSRYNFYLKGIVQSPDLTTSGLNFSIKDSTGSIIVIATTDISGYKPVIGDSIELRGLLVQNEGLTEVITDSVLVLNNASPLVSSTLVPALSENAEASLIKLDNFYIADKTQWTSSSKGLNVKITNGMDTVVMFINNNSDLFHMAAPLELFNVTGIEIQVQPDSPYFGNYEIEPRGSFDLERVPQLYKISQVRVQDPTSGIADSAGSPYNFYLKGIVQSPDFIKSGYEFSIKDSTGSIFVAASNQINNYVPMVGDSIEIRGLLTQANGLTEVIADSISKLQASSVVLKPEVVNTLSESSEANLVEYDHARLVNASQWIPSGAGFNVDITNGTDTISLYISSSTPAFLMPVPKGKFNVLGIGSQDKSIAPYIGKYMLLPRDITDFEFLQIPLYKIRQVKGYNAISGIADSIETRCYLKGIVQSGNLSGSSKLFYSMQDSTGSITLASDFVISGYIPQTGDSVITSGTVLQSGGLTYFATDSVSKISAAMPIPSVSVSVLNENTESELVTLNGYTLVDPSKWDTTAAATGFFVKAYNASDTITLAIMRGTDLFSNTAKPDFNFEVTGIGSQNDQNTPYLSGYYLIPRNLLDIQHNSAVSSLNMHNSDIEIFPNPSSGIIYIRSSKTITAIEINDLVGKNVMYKVNGGSATEKLDINYLSKGVYVVKIYDGSGYEIEKIVKN